MRKEDALALKLTKEINTIVGRSACKARRPDTEQLQDTTTKKLKILRGELTNQSMILIDTTSTTLLFLNTRWVTRFDKASTLNVI